MLIGQFGTFEVENYGDRLFPLIAEKELSQRLPEGNIQLYSPLGSYSPASHPIISKTGIPFHESSLPDAILIGGGDIISFATEIAALYEEEWVHSLSPHSACWALPSIFRKSGSPLIWNAPGVPIEFTQEQMLIVNQLAAEADYITVRDTLSRKRLQTAGVTAEITVVPDTALILPNHFSKDSLRKSAKIIFDKLGISLGEPLVVQVHPCFIQDNIPSFVSTIIELKKRLGQPVLLLPIGYCHGDHLILKSIEEASQGEFQLIENKLELLSIAAVIAHAGSFLGTSLHGNITAFSYGVPFLIYSCVHLAKLEGFAELIQEPLRICFNMNQMIEKSELLTVTPSNKTYEKLCGEISVHFDRVVKTITSPSPYRSDKYSRKLLEQYLFLMHHKEKTARFFNTREREINIRECEMKNEISRKNEEIKLLKELLQRPSLIKQVVRKIVPIGLRKLIYPLTKFFNCFNHKQLSP